LSLAFFVQFVLLVIMAKVRRQVLLEQEANANEVTGIFIYVH
jgi:hypothetical protein